MKDKHVCKGCLCYSCDNNDKCLNCCGCDDDRSFMDKDEEYLCDQYREIKD